MMECILSVYQHLSERLVYEGNLQITKTPNNDYVKCETITTFFRILLGMLATIFGCAFLAFESIQLVIAAVLYFLASKKLVVVSFWNRIIFVRSIGIWFRKPPKQPGKSKGRIIMFEHGARGFLRVSACVGGRVNEHTDARKRG